MYPCFSLGFYRNLVLNASYLLPISLLTSSAALGDAALAALRERPLLWTLRAVWLTDRPLCRVLPGGSSSSSSRSSAMPLPAPFASRAPVVRATAPELVDGDDPAAHERLQRAQRGEAGAGGGVSTSPGAGADTYSSPLSAFGVAGLLGREQPNDMCAQVYTLARPGQPSPCVLVELGPGSVATPATLTPYFLVHAIASVRGECLSLCE